MHGLMFPNTVFGMSPKEHNAPEETLDCSRTVNFDQVLAETFTSTRTRKTQYHVGTACNWQAGLRDLDDFSQI